MKIKELINQLEKMPLDSEIVITYPETAYYCDSFEVVRRKDDECQQIILHEYITY